MQATPTDPNPPAASSRLHAAAALALAFANLPAQELIGVNFQGMAYGVDVTTGQSRLIGPTGVGRCNAMAQLDGVLYATAQVGLFGPRQLVTIDAITAQATVVAPSLGVDLRGLAADDTSPDLFGIADGSPDRLVRIDVTTGQVTNIGNTGLTAIQALDGESNAIFLMGWDLNLGLVRIDKTNGAAVDVNLNVGTQNADIQFLTTFRDNNSITLLGGNSSLYAINAQTGVVTQIGTNTSLADLRGAETHRGRIAVIGTGCATTNGSSAQLDAKSNLLAGQPLGLLSRTHAPNSIVLLVVGLSSTLFQGAPLPVLLDPVLGTSGCQLFVSPDLTTFAFANASGLAPLPFTMPPVPGATLHFQSASLEAVPGGFAFSNGLTVQVPF